MAGYLMSVPGCEQTFQDDELKMEVDGQEPEPTKRPPTAKYAKHRATVTESSYTPTHSRSHNPLQSLHAETGCVLSSTTPSFTPAKLGDKLSSGPR